jgi:hypothetical protein
MVQQPTDEELFNMQRQRAVMERELLRHVISEKERRRQAKKAAAAAAGLREQHQQRRSSPKKSSPRAAKLASMTPIAEAGE